MCQYYLNLVYKVNAFKSETMNFSKVYFNIENTFVLNKINNCGNFLQLPLLTVIRSFRRNNDLRVNLQVSLGSLVYNFHYSNLTN